MNLVKRADARVHVGPNPDTSISLLKKTTGSCQSRSRQVGMETPYRNRPG